MEANNPPRLHRPPHTDQPVFWFALWEEARSAGDHGGAAHARAQLRRLGVAVYPEPPEPTGREPAHVR
jgi:hypothetical protein